MKRGTTVQELDDILNHAAKLSTSTIDCATPPADPVKWEAVSAKLHSRCTVKARTWFDARVLAMKKLGCGPNELTVEMKSHGRK